MSSGLVDAPPSESGVPPRRRRRWVRWVVGITLAVVLVVVGATVSITAMLTGNVTHEDVSEADLGATRPPKVATSAMNVLVVGSDQRDGKNAKYGHSIAGERTDTIMLVHVSSERDNAMVVSFPRDSLVQLPACRGTKKFPGQQAHLGMINESFNSGGIGCTWKTIESLTRIRIDHYVKVDFTGFKSMVNAVGGVQVCLPEPVDDKKALLRLPAGRQTLNGEQALGYVRARYSLGDGSDIGRIQRQQMFIASMIKKVMSGDTLTNPTRLYNVLNAGTKAVTTDSGLTPGVMLDLATSLKGIDIGSIRFITTPWHYSLTQPGRVEWVQPQARKLFQIVAKDQSVEGVKGGQTKVGRSKITVEVRNGTWRSGLATEVAAVLEQRGYHIAKTGDTAKKPQAKTTIMYGPTGETRVPTLSNDIIKATTRQLPAARTNRLVLVIGDDWKSLKPQRADDTEAIKGFDATHDTCAA
ncbi:LCP family protein [Nonomuraea maritima]|uniref:LCP family protein n=1 Tax=Nonomuraea maritima TaxID=683260 RepID=UPI000B85D886|nr:LCP family protein [Nonomuraea maritima]